MEGNKTEGNTIGAKVYGKERKGAKLKGIRRKQNCMIERKGEGKARKVPKLKGNREEEI